MGGTQNQGDQLPRSKGIRTVFRPTGDFVKAVGSRWTGTDRFELSIFKLRVICHSRHLLQISLSIVLTAVIGSSVHEVISCRVHLLSP